MVNATSVKVVAKVVNATSLKVVAKLPRNSKQSAAAALRPIGGHGFGSTGAPIPGIKSHRLFDGLGKARTGFLGIFQL